MNLRNKINDNSKLFLWTIFFYILIMGIINDKYFIIVVMYCTMLSMCGTIYLYFKLRRNYGYLCIIIIFDISIFITKQ